MVNLKSPIGTVKNIGPKYKALLEKLEINTIEDLLYHIPFRYDDFSTVKAITDLQNGEVATVKGTLSPVNNIFTKYGKKLTKAHLIDHTGKLEIVWYNQHYLKKVLQEGKTYTASGRVTLFDKKLCFVAPEMELETTNSLNTGRLVPVYSETQGISSKWLRSRINDILNSNVLETLTEETIPNKIIEKNNLTDIKTAIKKIHFPNTLSQIEEARYRLGFEELFYDLLKVEKRKYEWTSQQKSHKYKDFTKDLMNFISELPFTLTDSQIQSINEITNDLLTENPMNRLLEGDVGTGKTVVAVVAAYLTYLNGLKTLYLAPTEILANQHYETFSKLLAKTNAKVSLLTGSTKNIEDDTDIVIGTHAILYSKNSFKKVGLIIIDEQHRFGVEQRTKILEMARDTGLTPNLLTMTATPIPRTLALTIYGDLSLSTLSTHPKNERKVITKVVKEEQRDEIYSWIAQKGLATFIVCPFIETSETESLSSVKAAEDEYKTLSTGVFTGIPMGLIHGRMKPAEKNEVIANFKSGRTKVLVATPVIEVGIDIPDATVIVVEGGERYGLASLHQLRGRVGRQTGKGFCFVFMTTYSSKSYERLKHLEEIFDGMKLAEIDMKLRGQGDVFSTMQHGYKKYRVASLDDFALLEKAKQAAQETYQQLEAYPVIAKRLNQLTTEIVGNN